MEITDILNQKWNIDCIGCAINSGHMTPPGGILIENRSFYVQQDIEVPIEGFLVIGAKRHIQAISDFTNEEYKDFCSILLYSRKLINSLDNIRSITIIQEEHSPHFHLWLFPWHDWIFKKYSRLIRKHNHVLLSCIRPVMKQAKTELKTTEQIKRILDIVEQLKIKGSE